MRCGNLFWKLPTCKLSCLLACTTLSYPLVAQMQTRKKKAATRKLYSQILFKHFGYWYCSEKSEIIFSNRLFLLLWGHFLPVQTFRLLFIKINRFIRFRERRLRNTPSSLHPSAHRFCDTTDASFLEKVDVCRNFWLGSGGLPWRWTTKRKNVAIFLKRDERTAENLPALCALRLRDGNPGWKVCWKHINPKKRHSFQTGCRLEDVFGG